MHPRKLANTPDLTCGVCKTATDTRHQRRHRAAAASIISYAFPTCGSCMKTTVATRSDEGSSNVHAQRRRRWKVKRRVILAYRRQQILADYPSSGSRGQELTPSPPLMHLMKYAVPSVLVFVTLKYQAKTGPLFSEYPASLWCFLGATCVYWLIVGEMKRRTDIHRDCFQTLSCATLASAIFSVISMVSIFLPYPVSLLPVAILISLPMALALVYACCLFLRGIEYVTHGTHAILIWARGLNSTEEASLPV